MHNSLCRRVTIKQRKSLYHHITNVLVTSTGGKTAHGFMNMGVVSEQNMKSHEWESRMVDKMGFFSLPLSPGEQLQSSWTSTATLKVIHTL